MKRSTAEPETEPLLHQESEDKDHQSLSLRWRSFRSSQTYRLIVVSTALFTDNFIYGLIVPTLPYDLPKHSHIPIHNVEYWTSALLAAYGLSALIAAPLLGLLANRTSNRKTPLLLGLGLQIASTILYGCMHNVIALVVARLLQGLSAAIVYTSGLAFLVDSVDGDKIGSYIGAATAVENIGLMISPIVGGPVYQKLGRTALIGLIVVLIGIDIVLRLLIAESPKALTKDETPSSRASTYGTSDPEAQGERTVEAQGSDVESTRSPKPRLTIFQLLENPRILTAAYGLFLGQVFLTAFDGALPRFTERTYGWDATAAGLIFLALSLPSVLAVLAGKLTDKLGPKGVTVGGLILAVPSFVVLLPAQGDALANKVVLCVALALIGLAVAFVTAPLASDLAIVVESQDDSGPETAATGDKSYGQVFSILLFAQNAGILLGPTWASVAYKRISWTFMSISLTVLAATAIPLCLIFTGGPLRRKTMISAQVG